MVRRLLPALLAAAIFAAVPWGCTLTGSTGTGGAGGTIVIAPAGAPSLAILAPADGACVEAGEAPDAVLPITLGPTNLYLRPPGYCSVISNVSCGHAVARVNGVYNTAGSTPVLNLKLGNLANRFTDMTVAVAILKDDETPLINDDAGAPVTASIMIHVRKSCSSGSGSSSASSSSASSSSASSSSSGASSSGASSSSASGTGGAGGASASSSSASGTGGAGGSTSTASSSASAGGAGGTGPSDAGADGG
jgi:hypothetical protein